MELSDYHGREQTFLKHRILRSYLRQWAIKLGSVARRRPVRLCYVDVFAGPWNSAGGNLEDTSIAIALDALDEAANVWSAQGYQVVVEAFFVERDRRAFERLQQFLTERQGRALAHARRGEFADHAPAIARQLGRDAAFVFVDPTGWKGAAMSAIVPLVRGERRDVLVNVMFDHLNRFKDDPRAFLRDQMQAFFGLGDEELPPGLSEEELFELYRGKLKDRCGLRHAADLIVPHPTQARTKFRLVVGGNQPPVLEVFRDVEHEVVGAEAAEVRDAARSRLREARSGQLSLLAAPPPVDGVYAERHGADLGRLPEVLATHLSSSTWRRFGELWPEVLEALHVRKAEVARCAWSACSSGAIQLRSERQRPRSVKDDDWLRLAEG